MPLKILSITAGAAGMYCGSCSRDNALAVELLARGHEVTLLPLYTLVVPDDPSTLADGLYQLWHDRPLANAMGERGFNGVRTHYGIARSADRLLEVYDAVTNQVTERPLSAAASRA